MSQTLATKNQTVHKNTNHYFKRILHQLWNPLNFSEPQLAGEQGGQLPPLPPGPVEPDTLSLWMDLFSLDLVILVIVTCNCLLFSYSRSIFRRHITWQMLKRALRSLQIWKFSWGGYPQPHLPPLPPYKVRAFGTWDNAPSTVTKNLATALLLPRHKTLTNLFPMRIEPSSTGKILPTLSTRPILECKVTDSQ